MNLHEFSDDEQHVETVSKKLLKDSMCLSCINEKLSHKLKITESQNSSLASELDDVRAKVIQLESQRVILSKDLIDVGMKSGLLIAQCEKATKESDTLCTDLKISRRKSQWQANNGLE